eukprot:jgi/Psemu1/13125/gm1.13125_g
MKKKRKRVMERWTLPAVAAAAAGVTVTEFHLPSITDPMIPTLSVDSENNFRKIAAAAADRNFSLGAILNALKENPTALGTTTERIKVLTFNTTEYERKKTRLEFAFFKSLAIHPEAAPLVDFIRFPKHVEIPGMDLSKDPKLFGQAQYQSGVVSMKFRCLFATFRKNRITYSQTQDFNKAGGFQAYWKNVFKIAKTYKADLIRPKTDL